MATITSVLSNNIKRLRKEMGLTQTQLADSIGISLASIQGYEAERVWPAMDTVKALAKALHVSESALFADPDAGESLMLKILQLLPSASEGALGRAIRLLEAELEGKLRPKAQSRDE